MQSYRQQCGTLGQMELILDRIKITPSRIPETHLGVVQEAITEAHDDFLAGFSDNRLNFYISNWLGWTGRRLSATNTPDIPADHDWMLD